MLKHTRTATLIAALLLAILAAPAVTLAQQEADGPNVAELWNDFIHYIRIARPDLALSYGQSILQAQPDPTVVYRLSLETRDLLDTLRLGENLDGLGQTVAEIRRLIEQGYQAESRDPEQIAVAIEMLGGSLRQFQMGSERLKQSSEFAIPQLIQRLGDPQSSVLMRDRIISVLPTLGKDAVRPLSAVLQSPDPAVREIIARTLGSIGYRHAAPHLRAMIVNPDEQPRVRSTAEAALVNVAGRTAAQKSVAGLFYDLAESYYNKDESLRPDPRAATANVWYWREGLGLTYLEVPVEIFMDVYAMHAARRTLEADSSFSPAVSLWLAANLRRTATLPAGQNDPTRLPGEMSAAAYAKAAGAKYMQEVLARALKDNDAAVAFGAIEALQSVAGAENLLSPTAGGATPLVAAMTFPNRRVRFMAAQALADARPSRRFNGDELVVQVLAECLRQTGQRTALLIVPETEIRNQWKDMIRSAGYAVIDAENYGAAVEAARGTTGVDVAVISTTVQGPTIREAMAMMRANPVFANLPSVVLADMGSSGIANELARQDNLVIAADAPGLTQENMTGLLEAAAATGVGADAIADEEAAQWALSAARIIRQLALTRTEVYDLSRAEPALIDALRDQRNELKIAAARALSLLSSSSAQQAVVGLANDTQMPEPVRVAAYQAATESVRVIGNQLTEAQAATIIEVVKSGESDDLRSSASGLLGALNLSSEQIQSLIIWQ